VLEKTLICSLKFLFFKFDFFLNIYILALNLIVVPFQSLVIKKEERVVRKEKRRESIQVATFQ